LYDEIADDPLSIARVNKAAKIAGKSAEDIGKAAKLAEKSAKTVEKATAKKASEALSVYVFPNFKAPK
uniref:Uncharacterized protein n=1 Tax=Romanomermis culicivorax TaxID=13658 RepID=A0A915INJ7_ROMCU